MSLHPCVNHVTLDNTGRPYGFASLGAVNGGAVGVDTQRADVGIGPYGLASGPGGTDRGKINICTGKSFLDFLFLEMYNDPAMCKKLLPTGGYLERKEVRKVRKHCEQTRN